MYTLHRLYWVAVGGGEREHRYAMDYIFYASVPGQAPSFTEDFLLGLLISLGNAIVGNAVEIVVGWCGIRDQGALACRGTFKLVGD